MSDVSQMTDQPRRSQPAALQPSLAHVRRNDDGSFTIHHLEEHLRAVGDLAADFASSFGWSV